ncbi:MAG: hypothetical protein ACJA17_000219 [Polaribacter sp.]|jgi:hypothetical protein
MPKNRAWYSNKDHSYLEAAIFTIKKELLMSKLSERFTLSSK